MDTIAPAIALCSTADDMAQWMKLHLGTIYSQIKPVNWTLSELLQQLHKPEVLADNLYVSHIKRPQFPVSWVLESYGLGWFTGHYRGIDLCFGRVYV